ncbi:hypothetical protein [Rhizobium hidalgonense]|uniref:hypothetical protein n=1 Tax=Rhizobium hidalgonense TaxID=1538159 RepID=UPI0028713919|nr:hypothetical protein [Rhizobium hidalgonense]MDR9803253.1 hypothetical protein [Rhizobium hidalgonense]
MRHHALEVAGYYFSEAQKSAASRALALELAPRRVNVHAPGPSTPVLAKALGDGREADVASLVMLGEEL